MTCPLVTYPVVLYSVLILSGTGCGSATNLGPRQLLRRRDSDIPGKRDSRLVVLPPVLRSLRVRALDGWIKLPQGEDIARVMKQYEESGFPGAMSSVNVIHIHWGRLLYLH